MINVYQDEFIKIDWNESKMFNVFFAIGENGEYREVDVFTVMDDITKEKAIELANEHVQEINNILDNDQ